MYYTNYRFRNFVQKGAFVDAEFHPMRWYRFNMGDGFLAYLWAIMILPLLLDKSGYSQELIAYARQDRIMRNNDYLNFTYSSLEQERRSVQVAVKAYLRRVEDGQN
ncbi:hypothetical protein CVT25_006118 [Psilocybe cyanescens]|uniref:Uncharacterized protein n=1 Tax=Psilocybe cyanescens TaxID=93625 RepID=A0A409X759_PSICY|nr:hypothetical protein CVT25_006118 [Psilocybe cyanescens]